MGKRKARGGGFRRVLTFDEEKRREYLTGFHKRKVERRKVAVQELKKKIKEEQRKMREERHKEYMRMLKERQEALEEADELEQLVTSQTESLQYDHPNHTVTVTTISDLDLSGVGLLGLGEGEGQNEKEDEMSTAKTAVSLPKKAGVPLLSKKISVLTASLHAHSKKKLKGKKANFFQAKTKNIKAKVGKTSKAQRRKLTGRAGRNRE
ncbi:nucleolar protein 12 [Microcaecilia unicolor]|uniref:Nucleolar protein 12 n=1 Tax=Microcaecilia unicolor TaxID=1415580 RepID=A0A6P7Y8L2_9AMPH|nr:nucleolar protein 12 [Microcaecilia unicolor]